MAPNGVRGRCARARIAVLAGLACSVLLPAGAAPAPPQSAAPLQLITEVLQRTVHTPGTAWAADPPNHQVSVLVDGSVTVDHLAVLHSVTRRFGASVRITHVPGVFHLLMAGGDAIWGRGASRCSLGFNVIRSGQPYFLTAGHCANVVHAWSAANGGPPIGVTEASTYPGHDYAIVRYTSDVPHPSAVDLYNGNSRAITHAAEPIVGEVVERSGMASGVHPGIVRAVNATVNARGGTVSGLIEADICAVEGDSGGPLFDGDVALGLTSVGESGDCTQGGVSFYQPVMDALRAYGAQIG